MNMVSSVSFAEFAAGAPDADPFDRKALLFVYRAIEDLAAEFDTSVSELRILEALPRDRRTLPLARLRARVRSLPIEDALSNRADDRYDLVVAADLPARDLSITLSGLSDRMEASGLLLLTLSSGLGARGHSPLRFESAAAKRGLVVHRFMNAGFVLARMKAARRIPGLGSFDADFANLIPHWMASGWFVSLRKRR